MSKKLQLSIPKPCHESWDAMTPVEKGKFCGSCQKQVVDFSNMSDRQVAEFFKKPSTGSVCGRFMTDQLDRSIEIPKKRIPWLKYFFQFVIPAFLVSIKTSAQKTQGTVAVTKIAKDTTKIPKQPLLMGKVAMPVCTRPLMGDVAFVPVKEQRLSGTIQLKIVSEKGEPISYASIETGIIGKGGAADKNGLFSLDKSILDINGKIFVSSAGYERKEIAVKTLAAVKGAYEVLLRSKGWMNEVINAINPNQCKVTMGAAVRIDTSQLTGKRTIQGFVVDEKGDALPGASVNIKGTRTGVFADSMGRFHILAKSGDIFLVSGAGLVPTEASIGNVDTIFITVKRYIVCSKEVVMVGGVSVKKIREQKQNKTPPVMRPITINPKLSNLFKVFPNPVPSGTNLNIEVKKAEEGYYTLQLLNQSGQSVHQQQIWIDADARLLNIDIPSVSAGDYFLVLINRKSGKRYAEKLFIL